jgi:hypothetical protein
MLVSPCISPTNVSCLCSCAKGLWKNQYIYILIYTHTRKINFLRTINLTAVTLEVIMTAVYYMQLPFVFFFLFFCFKFFFIVVYLLLYVHDMFIAFKSMLEIKIYVGRWVWNKGFGAEKKIFDEMEIHIDRNVGKLYLSKEKVHLESTWTIWYVEF